MKIKLNLENFQNITLEAPKELDKDRQYIILLDQAKDWVGFTPHAKPLVDRLRSILEKEEGKGEISVEVNNPKSSILKSVAETDSKPLPVITEGVPITESTFMDLTDVTIVGQTPKSWVVFKDDMQKLVPFSLMLPTKEPIKLQGRYSIKLTEKAEQWFHDKPWKPYVPYKGGGN